MSILSLGHSAMHIFQEVFDAFQSQGSQLCHLLEFPTRNKCTVNRKPQSFVASSTDLDVHDACSEMQKQSQVHLPKTVI